MGTAPSCYDICRDQRLDGRVILITGPTAGIGYETACAMAGTGAHVVMAGRSLLKLQVCERRIQQYWQQRWGVHSDRDSSTHDNTGNHVDSSTEHIELQQPTASLDSDQQRLVVSEQASTGAQQHSHSPHTCHLTLLQCDFSDLVSVEQFANAYSALNLPCHILICNAGNMITPSLSARLHTHCCTITHSGVLSSSFCCHSFFCFFLRHSLSTV